MYSYCMVGFTCVGISILVGRRGCSMLRYRKLVECRSILPTRLLILLHLKVPYRTCIYNRLPEDEPSGSKDVEDIRIKN
jgi:hypothetical protein